MLEVIIKLDGCSVVDLVEVNTWEQVFEYVDEYFGEYSADQLDYRFEVVIRNK